MIHAEGTAELPLRSVVSMRGMKEQASGVARAYRIRAHLCCPVFNGNNGGWDALRAEKEENEIVTVPNSSGVTRECGKRCWGNALL